jgi:hypothetical protein
MSDGEVAAPPVPPARMHVRKITKGTRETKGACLKQKTKSITNDNHETQVPLALFSVHKECS